MSALLEIVEGWTGVLGPFTLRVDGVPLDLTGLTVALKLHNSLGAVVVPGGATTVMNQGTNPGQVTYQPVAGDFTMSTGANTNPVRQAYQLHWMVTDGAGKVVYFPNGISSEVTVFRA